MYALSCQWCAYTRPALLTHAQGLHRALRPPGRGQGRREGPPGVHDVYDVRGLSRHLNPLLSYLLHAHRPMCAHEAEKQTVSRPASCVPQRAFSMGSRALCSARTRLFSVARTFCAPRASRFVMCPLSSSLSDRSSRAGCQSTKCRVPYYDEDMGRGRRARDLVGGHWARPERSAGWSEQGHISHIAVVQRCRVRIVQIQVHIR
jgi:hypothetical protein